MKDYDEIKESLCLKHCCVNNLYGQTMSQKFPVDEFKSVENISQFNKDFTENYNDYRDEGYFLKDDVQYSEKLH